jgi:putative nucleotidyltransferase with HDIG domain
VPKNKGKVLLVDDNVALLEMMARYLKHNGFEVLEAESGEDGLRQAKQTLPHLVVLDSMMPDMDGLKVLKSLKADRNTKGIPVLMLTSLSRQEMVAEALKYGAVDYVVKGSISSAALCERIGQLVTKRKDNLEGTNTENASSIESARGIPGRRQIIADGEMRTRISKLAARDEAPEAVTRIISLAAKHPVPASEWADEIKRFPQIAEKFTALAQSGLREKANEGDDLHSLAAHRGAEYMNHTGVMLALTEFFTRYDDEDIQDQFQHWRHCLTCATIARGIALYNGWGNTDMVFTAAMLHDVGLPMMRKYMEKEYLAVREEIYHSADPLCEVEQTLLGTDHAQFAAALLKGWGISHEIVEAVEMHHTAWEKAREAAKYNPAVVALVQLADTLAKTWSSDIPSEVNVSEPPDEMMDFLALREGSIEAARRSLDESYAGLEDALLGKIRDSIPNEAGERAASDALAGTKVGIVDDAPPQIDPLRLFLEAKNASTLHIKPDEAERFAPECNSLVYRLRKPVQKTPAFTLLRKLEQDSARKIPAVLVVQRKEDIELIRTKPEVKAKVLKYPYSLAVIADLLTETAKAETTTV